MKKCFKCGEEKDLNDFYVHSQMGDGHLNKCKECTKKDAKEIRITNNEYYKNYDKSRAMLPHRVEARKKYADDHPDKIRVYREKYVVNNPDKVSKAKNEYRLNNKQKCIAHSRLQYAVDSQKIIKKPCEMCGNKKSQAHHDDYSKPLDVKWLCSKHHGLRHRELNKLKKI